MAKTTRKTSRAGGMALDQLVAETLGRLSDDLLSGGSIHVEVTEGGGQFHIRRKGSVESGPPEGAAVRIRGSAVRIHALLNGKKHPSAVFTEGGIHVAGDVRQITALSEELPALTLKRRRS